MIYSRIIESSLRNPWVVALAALALLVAGALQLQSMPVDVLPDVTRPLVTVQTEVPGMAPEDVESQVTYPVEAALGGLQDITRIRSVSSPGLSVVYAEFSWGSEPYRNRQLVTERIDSIRSQLGPGAEPRISPQTSLMGEVYLLALQDKSGASTPMQVREFADWGLKPRLLALPGVAQVTVIGGEVKQYEIHPDPGKLRLLGVTLAQIDQAVSGFGSNGNAGFANAGGSEWAMRSIGRPLSIEDLQQTAVAWQGAGAIRLGQVADIDVGAKLRRGDAGANGGPAVILAVQKQPGADSLRLTGAIEDTLANARKDFPPGVEPLSLFRQADFIAESVNNVRDGLFHGAIIVGIVLLLFLRGRRLPLIALAVIPLSLLSAILVLRGFGLSINTMTLGGLAIAVGELVDDAVVGLENTVRRLRAAGAISPAARIRIIAEATLEVRSGVLYATLLVVIALLPLFAMQGIEARLFAPLALAYVAAIGASLLVAITLTPVLCRYVSGQNADALLERPWLAGFKQRYARLLQHCLHRPRTVYIATAILAVCGIAMAAILPRSFLPAFNERSLTVNVLMQPGVSLDESSRIGALAENLSLQVPEVTSVGRRTGRAENDEHAEGVHYTELEIALRTNGRKRSEIVDDLRTRLSVLPASLVFGQPISHRLDHLLSGVRAPLVVKIYGESLDTLQDLAAKVSAALADIPGLADVQAEKLAQVPQLQVRVDARRAAQYGASAPRVQDALAELSVGKTVSRIIEGDRRFDLAVRLPQATLAPDMLGNILFDTPAGPVPLSWLADVSHGAGPNQIARENLRRRIAVSAYFDDRHARPSAQAVSQALQGIALPPGYELKLEGESEEAQHATARLLTLSLLTLLLMAGVLYGRYRSWTLVPIILINIPLAMLGGVFALFITGTPLSVASLVGFITLAGIAARNGILKVSHYLNLALDEKAPLGDALVIRGSIERLTPVLLTAGVTALALLPLLISANAPGKEILHPVALVIFGGLLGATILDSLLVPLLFRRYAAASVQHLISRAHTESTY